MTPTKSLGKRTIGMMTDILSDTITKQSRDVGALGFNQRFKVTDVEVEGDVTYVEGELLEKEIN